MELKFVFEMLPVDELTNMYLQLCPQLAKGFSSTKYIKQELLGVVMFLLKAIEFIVELADLTPYEYRK